MLVCLESTAEQQVVGCVPEESLLLLGASPIASGLIENAAKAIYYKRNEDIERGHNRWALRGSGAAYDDEVVF